MYLSSGQKELLRKGLVEAFPSLDSLKQLVMDGLGLRIEENIPVENRTHESIVFDLIKFTEGEGLTYDLIIAASDKMSKGSRALRAFLRRYNLWRSLVERLPDLFEVATQGGVRQIYQRAVPPGWKYSGKLAPASAADCIWTLTDPPTERSGIKHLLLFVRMLGQELYQQREGELRAWEDKVLERRFRGHEQRTRLKRELDRMVEADRTVRARDKQPTSLFRVESLKSEGKSGFRMASWLFTSRDPKGRPLGEMCELDMAGIPERLAEIRELVADQVTDLDQVRFEFLVPIELLCREVDQWPVREQLSNDKTPIGFYHQVVVRCWNRLKASNSAQRDLPASRRDCRLHKYMLVDR